MTCRAITTMPDHGDDARYVASAARRRQSTWRPASSRRGGLRAGDPLEEMLAAVRDRLVTRPDTRVGGLVPRNGPPHSNGRASLWLDDVGAGRFHCFVPGSGPRIDVVHPQRRWTRDGAGAARRGDRHPARHRFVRTLRQGRTRRARHSRGSRPRGRRRTFPRSWPWSNRCCRAGSNSRARTGAIASSIWTPSSPGSTRSHRSAAGSALTRQQQQVRPSPRAHAVSGDRLRIPPSFPVAAGSPRVAPQSDSRDPMRWRKTRSTHI